MAVRAAAPGARKDRDLQPLALRGGRSSSACTRSSSRGRSCRAARRDKIWERRFREINDWERHLTDNGFRIVKLFLNLSKEEQRKRFLRRIDDPAKNWKFSLGDLASAPTGTSYQRAFSEMLSHTSTEWAPWYVIPADRKWFARLAAAAVLLHTLMEIDPPYPVLDEEQRRELEEGRAQLEAEAPETTHGSGEIALTSRNSMSDTTYGFDRVERGVGAGDVSTAQLAAELKAQR